MESIDWQTVSQIAQLYLYSGFISQKSSEFFFSTHFYYRLKSEKQLLKSFLTLLSILSSLTIFLVAFITYHDISLWIYHRIAARRFRRQSRLGNRVGCWAEKILIITKTKKCRVKFFILEVVGPLWGNRSVIIISEIHSILNRCSYK